MKAGGSGDSDYKLYAIQFIKGLKYLDYEVITEHMKEQAKQKHTDEAQGAGEEGNEKKVEEVDQDLIDARIEDTHKMIEKIQDSSEEAAQLRNLPKYPDCWGQFEQMVDELTQKYQQEVKTLTKEKKRNIIFCDKTLKDSELAAEKKCIKLIQGFESLKKHKIKTLETSENKMLEIDDCQDDLKKAVIEVEDGLLEVEMLLQDALNESSNIFFDKIKTFNKTIDSKTVTFIGEVQMHGAAFQE